jgi:hypothetical protein
MSSAYVFLKITFQLISETRSLSADCLPSLLGANACGVSASQFFGRSVANFFHPIRSTGKKLKRPSLIHNSVGVRSAYVFFLNYIPVDFRNPLPFYKARFKIIIKGT